MYATQPVSRRMTLILTPICTPGSRYSPGLKAPRGHGRHCGPSRKYAAWQRQALMSVAPGSSVTDRAGQVSQLVFPSFIYCNPRRGWGLGFGIWWSHHRIPLASHARTQSASGEEQRGESGEVLQRTHKKRVDDRRTDLILINRTSCAITRAQLRVVRASRALETEGAA